MMKVYVLWAIAIAIVILNKECPSVVKLKKTYEQFLANVNDDPDLPEKFEPLKRRVLLTGFRRPPWGNELGYNINKGSEISVCADEQNENAMIHVLSHELAHSTVKEYKHNEEFHNNMDDIKKMMIKYGLYTPMKKQQQYCGIKISDGSK
jgi:hypothetical protein